MADWKVYSDINEVFYDDELQHPTGWLTDVKIGATGKDHKTPRHYSKVIERGSVGGYQNYGDLVASYPLDFGIAPSKCSTSNEAKIFHNRVVSRLRGRLGPTAQLGTSLFAEGGEAVNLAIKNLSELAAIARAIKRKDISALKRVWNKPRRAQRAFAEAGGRWLEFSWGWSPTVQTIADALAVTSSEPVPKKITSVHSCSYHWQDYVSVDGERKRSDEVKYYRSLKCGFDVQVSNPNLWIASSFDLINPGSWMYEAIPYSWLADYFANVGSVISSMGQFAGLVINGRYSTLYEEYSTSRRVFSSKPEPHTVVGTSGGSRIRRSLDTPSLDIKLTYNFKNPLTSSWKRGLNSAGFLATRLK